MMKSGAFGPPGTATPHVTIVVPACDEASDVRHALDAVLAQTIPHELVEVLVVTGGSTDDTAATALAHLAGSGFARVSVLRPTDGSTPANLNAGLDAARGTYLCRVDSRSLIPPDYVERCVEVLSTRPEVAVVGGAQVAVARGDTPTELGIARALNNRWGMGWSRYRSGASSGPTDTVYLGAFRTAELRAAGGWDERFATNQDFELNRRMARQGQVWFESGLEVGYLPRQTLPELFMQYRRFGRWKVHYWEATGDPPRPRQLVLLVAPVVVAVCVAVLTPRRRSTVLAVTAAGALGGVAVEALGAGRPAAGPKGHLAAQLALGAVATGWLSGVWQGLVARLLPRPAGGRGQAFARAMARSSSTSGGDGSVPTSSPSNDR